MLGFGMKGQVPLSESPVCCFSGWCLYSSSTKGRNKTMPLWVGVGEDGKQVVCDDTVPCPTATPCLCFFRVYCGQRLHRPNSQQQRALGGQHVSSSAWLPAGKQGGRTRRFPAAEMESTFRNFQSWETGGIVSGTASVVGAPIGSVLHC